MKRQRYIYVLIVWGKGCHECLLLLLLFRLWRSCIQNSRKHILRADAQEIFTWASKDLTPEQ